MTVPREVFEVDVAALTDGLGRRPEISDGRADSGRRIEGARSNQVGVCPQVVTTGNGGVQGGMHAVTLIVGEHVVAVGVLHEVLYVLDDRRIADCTRQVARGPALGFGSVLNLIITTSYAGAVGASPRVLQIQVVTGFV